MEINVNHEVNTILSNASSLKKDIVKTMIRADRSDLRYVDNYLMFVNNSLKKWEDIGNDIRNKIRDKEPAENDHAVSYDDIKKYVYAKYDYASILQFTDGVIKGIESGKFKDNDDVVDFMAYTTSRAFRGLDDTVGDVLNELIDDTSRNYKSDVSKFNAFKGYDFIDRRDRVELYKAIEKVLKYLIKTITDDIDRDKGGLFNIDKMNISMINAVIDYASFSLNAYMSRIYAIQEFAFSYIGFFAVAAPIGESTEIESIGKRPISLMKEFEDLTFRDPNQTHKAKAIMEEFCNSLGGTVTDDNLKKYEGKKTTFVSNKLYDLIMKNRGMYFCNRYMANEADDPVNIIEYNHLLGLYSHNASQAIGDTSTPKQELLYSIKNFVPSNETSGEYASIATTLYTVFHPLLAAISNSISECMRSSTKEYRASLNPTEQHALSNTITMLKELYGEIADALLFRFRDIEMKINILRNTEVDKVFDSLEIKIPGEKNEYSSDENMMMGIPDTTREPLGVEATNGVVVEYSMLPAFEYYELFDEFAKTLPGMEDCLYYSEAFDFNTIINAIGTFINECITKLAKFLANDSVKKAAAYVSKNQNTLRSMKFNQPMNNIIPYQKDITIGFLNTFITQVNSFDPKLMINDDAINNYFANIFGNDKVAVAFDEKKVKKENAYNVFNNYVACGIDPATNPTGKIQPKQLNNDAEIKKELEIWIDNVISYADGLNEVSNKMNELKNGVNSLKSKIATMSTDNQASTGAPAMTVNDIDGSQTNTNTTQARETSDQQKQNTAENAKLQGAVTKLQGIVSTLTKNLMMTLVSSIKTQYSYIQQAEKIGSSGQQQAQQQAQQQNQTQ